VKRRILTPLVILARVVALVACRSSRTSSGDRSAASGGTSADGSCNGQPLIIGLVPPTSASLAVFGENEARAPQFRSLRGQRPRWRRRPQGAERHRLGRADTAGDDPRRARARAPKQRTLPRGAHLVSRARGGEPTAGRLNALDFNATAKGKFLIGAQCTANMFNVVQPAQMDVTQIGQALSKLPATIMADDHSTVRDSATGSTAAVQNAGACS
jgi:hypothetical protein